MKKQLFSITALLAVTLFSAQAQEKRVPLFEMFTSSTCPPCNPGNAALDGVVSSKPVTEYALVKYQQYFPGTGDPYTTAEGRTRFLSYYNPTATQIGVPELHINGGEGVNPLGGGITEAKYTAAKNEAATYKLSGTYSVANKVVTANLKYTAISAGTSPVLYVAIVETKTIKNVKTNGETEFHNVMKKMMPSQAGTPLTEAVGTEGSKSLTFTFKGNYRLPANGQPSNYINDASENSVEDFNNLKVVAWVQGSDKKVYQAANLTKSGSGTGVSQVSRTVGAVEVYPNPASDRINININMKEQDEVSASIVSLTGAVVARQSLKMNAGKNTMSFETQSLAAGLYNIIIFDSNNNSFAQRVAVVR